MAKSGLLCSAAYLSDGGLAKALVTSCVGTKFGASVRSFDDTAREFRHFGNWNFLFAEEACTALVTCSSENKARIKSIADGYGLEAEDIGNVVYRSGDKASDADFEIWLNEDLLVSGSYLIAALESTYTTALESALAEEVLA